MMAVSASGASSEPLASWVRYVPLCLMRYLPRTMRRQSKIKTMTATTPPITAWSTPEVVDMAVGSVMLRASSSVKVLTPFSWTETGGVREEAGDE